MVLKRWYSGFDPRSEKQVRRHLWVILPDYPIQCWNLEGFMVVVTAISSFMLIEDDQLLGFDRSSPRVMVDMDLSDGLPDELEV